MAVQKIDNLNIHENPATNENEFDVENYMNANWNKIKEVVNNNADELNTAQENISNIQEEQETQNEKISTLETDNTTNKEDISDIKTKNNEQDTNIEELQENLSDAQQEIEALKTIQNALPTIDGEGENVKLVGTAENTTFKKFEICGNSSQESREGYNLIDIVNSSLMGQDKGVTIEISDDGYITANGTPTTAYTVFISKNVTNLLEDGQTYSIWQENYSDNDLGEIYSQIMANPVSGSSSTQQFFTSGKNRKTFTVNKSNYTYTWNIQIGTLSLAGTFDNYKNRYMLYKGTDNKEKFELYGAMPSPDFSSKVECVGDDVNLYNENAEKTDYYIADNGSEYVGVNNDIFTKQIISENLEKQYTMSFEKNNSANVRFAYYNEDTFISREVSNVNKHTFTVPDNCTKIDIRVDEVSGSGKYFDKLKIQKGVLATAYSKFGQGTANGTVCNKNLCNNGENYENWRPTSTSDGTITYNSKGFKVTTEGGNSRLINLRELPHLEDGKTYILSYKVTELPSGKGVQARYIKNDGTEEYGGAVTQSGKIGKLTITDADIKTLTIFGQSGISGSFTVEDIQIEKNSVATDYVEHQEQNFTMPVQKEMLENDYFDLDTLEEVHNWNEIDVSTLLSKDIAIGSASTDEYYVFQIPLCSETQRAKEVLCEKFKFLGFETASISRKEEGITINTDAKRLGRVWIKASRLSEKSISAFLNWCSEENIIAKALIEDVETRLPMTAEQITIAKQIKNTLISYKDTTHVYSEDKISPIFKCSAIADMTAMLDNLQAQILANEEV